MKHKTIIFDATEAVNPQRRGIGVQMRSWLELAPFTDYPHLQFLLVSRATSRLESLHVEAPNVEKLYQETRTEEAYIDYLYSLGADLLFFPLASQKYVRESPTRIVGIDYGMEDLYCRNYIAPQPVTEIMQWHEFAQQHYTSIVTVSKTSRRDLVWFFPEHKDKIHVIYSGSMVTATPSEAKLPEALKGMPYFLVVGYEHKKNIMRIASAFDAFKQKSGSSTRLVIIGSPGFGAAEIDTHINALTSAKDIVRLGYVSDAEKRLLMQQCHAVVALAVYEGFGISALEGLQAGKIILVSNNGSLKEVAGKAGYTANPFSTASIENQLTFIDRLSENPKKKFIPGRLAAFDQSVQAKKLVQLLSEIVV